MHRYVTLDELSSRLPSRETPLDAFARLARTYMECAPEEPLRPRSWAALDDADKRKLLDDSLTEYMNAGPTGLY